MLIWLVLGATATPVGVNLPCKISLGSENYSSLPAAVNAAAVGSTLLLQPGSCTTAPIQLTKSLLIKAADPTNRPIVSFTSDASPGITVQGETSLSTLTLEDIIFHILPRQSALQVSGQQAEIVGRRLDFAPSSLSSWGADTGKAIVVSSGYLTLEDSTFTGLSGSSSIESDGYNGGAISVASSPAVSITGGSFSQNTARFGGAIWSKNSQVHLTEVLFKNNKATNNGGAIWSKNSQVHLTDVLFKNNEATNNGGAVYTTHSAPTLGSSTIKRSAFCDGSAEHGRAIASLSDEEHELHIYNTVFRSSGPANTSALTLKRTDLSLWHSTFVAVEQTDAASLLIESQSSQLQLNRNLFVLPNTLGTPVSATDSQVAGSDNHWSPALPPTHAGDSASFSHIAVAVPPLGSEPCDDPWFWPELNSEVVDLTPYTGLDADLDGSAPDAGASGGPSADSEIWGDRDGDGVANHYDCDEDDPSVYPGAEEVCDGTDHDCDGYIDNDPIDGDPRYEDRDGDGYGGEYLGEVCGSPLSTSTDCDDDNPDIGDGDCEPASATYYTISGGCSTVPNPTAGSLLALLLLLRRRRTSQHDSR